MKATTGRVRTLAERSGIIRLARVHRAATEFTEAVEENRMLEIALAERVAYLEQAVGEFAHKRATASTEA